MENIPTRFEHQRMLGLPAYSDPEPNPHDDDVAIGAWGSKLAKSRGRQTYVKNRWGVGRMTPALIILLYVFSTIVAILHFTLYYCLDGKLPTPVLHLYWAQTIGNALSTIFKAAVTGTLGIAYMQYLWQLFRAKSIRASTIDQLLSLLYSPYKLLDVQLFHTSSIAWLAGIFCLSIPTAMIFPPASLTLTSSPPSQPERALIGAPTLNAIWRDDMEWERISLYAIFDMDTDLFYMNPKPNIQAVAYLVTLSGNILPWASPALTQLGSLNSSYETTFSGPTFSCTDDEDRADSSGLVGSKYQYSTRVNFSDKFAEHFTIYYRHEWEVDGQQTVTLSSPLRKLDCITSISNYHVNFSWLNGVQSTKILDVSPKIALSAFPDDLYPYYLPTRDAGEAAWAKSTVTIEDNSLLDVPGHPAKPALRKQTFLQVYEQYSMGAIADSLINGVLAGNISEWGFEGENVVQTLVLQTPFAKFNASSAGYLQLDLTPAGLEELIQNVTKSLISLNLWQDKNATVLTNDWLPRYAFNRWRLVAPYAFVLALSIPFITLGLSALWNNGVPATAGFLQIVATTQNSRSLREVAADASLGGEANFSKAYRAIRLRYGGFRRQHEVGNQESQGHVGGDDESSSRIAGCGTVDEVEPLIKGKVYFT